MTFGKTCPLKLTKSDQSGVHKEKCDPLMRNTVYKIFVYSLCLSLLLLTSRTSMMVAEAKEKNIPIGEMVSKGEVRFEARENSWKNVEPFHFPVFRGVKIKTEKGISVIALVD